MGKLTPRQQLFIEYYLQGFNASEAARRAGYRSRSNTAGSRLLTNDDILKAIQERTKEIAMTTDEALARLATHARGNMEDFITIDDDGQLRIDLLKARELNQLHLIKRLTISKGVVSIELYDAQAALIQLLRMTRPTLPLPSVDIDATKELLRQKLTRLALPSDWLH